MNCYCKIDIIKKGQIKYIILVHTFKLTKKIKSIRNHKTIVIITRNYKLIKKNYESSIITIS